MERINALIQSKAYQDYLEKNRLAERERIFCGHGFEHMLAVARIAYIYCLERVHVLPGNPMPLRADHSESPYTELLTKEVIYAAGLLHDIGRWLEYETGEDHAQVSARLAEPLLVECGFSGGERELILESIRRHRQKPKDVGGEATEANPLVTALALADLWSRDCLHCPARPKCYKTNFTSNWLLTV